MTKGCESCPLHDKLVPENPGAFCLRKDELVREFKPSEMVLSPYSLSIMDNKEFEETVKVIMDDDESLEHFGWMIDQELINRGMIGRGEF